MVRKILAAVFCVGICLGLATADEFKGKVKIIDTDKKTITVTVDGTDMVFTTTADTKYSAKKKGEAVELKGGLASKQLKEGANVTVVTPDGKKDTATEVRLGGKKKKTN
jgi:hypothetical protein